MPNQPLGYYTHPRFPHRSPRHTGEMRSGILLPFLVAAVLAAPIRQQQQQPRQRSGQSHEHQHQHRLGRSAARRGAAASDAEPRSHYAGRLSGSRLDERDARPPRSHDIPDSGEIWDLPEPVDMEILAKGSDWSSGSGESGARGEKKGSSGLVFAGAKGLSEEIVTKAWTDLVAARPEATGEGQAPGAGDEGERRSWFLGEYVGDLEVEGYDTDDEGDLYAWRVYNGEPAYGYEGDDNDNDDDGGGGDRRAWMDDYQRGLDGYSTSDTGIAITRPSDAQIVDDSFTDKERFRIAARASVPVGGWAINARGEWYLAHMD